MAIVIGFIVVLAAGMAGAYFVGTQSTRLNTPPLPTRENNGRSKSGFVSDSSQADPAKAVIGSQPVAQVETQRDLPTATVVVKKAKGLAGGPHTETRAFERLDCLGLVAATISTLR